MPINVMVQVVYPRASKDKNIAIVISSVIICLSYSFISILIAYYFSEYIVVMLGGVDMIDSVDTLKILIYLVPLSSINWNLGNNIMMVNDMKKEFLITTWLSSLSLLLGLFFLYLYSSVNSITVSYIMVAAAIVLMVSRTYYCYKFKFLS